MEKHFLIKIFVIFSCVNIFSIQQYFKMDFKIKNNATLGTYYKYFKNENLFMYVSCRDIVNTESSILDIYYIDLTKKKMVNRSSYKLDNYLVNVVIVNKNELIIDCGGKNKQLVLFRLKENKQSLINYQIKYKSSEISNLIYSDLGKSVFFLTKKNSQLVVLKYSYPDFNLVDTIDLRYKTNEDEQVISFEYQEDSIIVLTNQNIIIQSTAKQLIFDNVYKYIYGVSDIIFYYPAEIIYVPLGKIEYVGIFNYLNKKISKIDLPKEKIIDDKATIDNFYILNKGKKEFLLKIGYGEFIQFALPLPQ